MQPYFIVSLCIGGNHGTILEFPLNPLAFQFTCMIGDNVHTSNINCNLIKRMFTSVSITSHTNLVDVVNLPHSLSTNTTRFAQCTTPYQSTQLSSVLVSLVMLEHYSKFKVHYLLMDTEQLYTNSANSAYISNTLMNSLWNNKFAFVIALTYVCLLYSGPLFTRKR